MIYEAVITLPHKVYASFFSFVYSLFFLVTACGLHAQTVEEFQYIDRKGCSSYPVRWEKNTARILVVPQGQSHQAQFLMAATYQVLKDTDIDTIVLVCQGDEDSFYGVALPLDCESLCSEKLSIDTDFIAKLSEHRLFYYYQVPFSHNLSVPFQCKFLEFYGQDIKIVPLIIGSISKADAFEMAIVIASCCGCNSLIVLSVDIGLHENVVYHCPCDQSKICTVYDQDGFLIQAIQSIGLQKIEVQENILSGDLERSSVFGLLFELLQISYFKNLSSYFVGYTTSNSDNKAMESVESYGAFVFQENETGYKNHIGFYEQSQLLQHARTELHNFFELNEQRLPSMMSYEMMQPHGVYASLYGMSDHGVTLRGCMGKVESRLSLMQMVSQMTQLAAYKDIRFYPLRQKELVGTIISLSLIHDLEKIDNYEDIREFDGLMLQYDDKDVVSLPLKISTPNWNYESALNKLSEQISLHSCLWKKPRAKVFTFHPQVFQEE